ncbi:MAG: hypothetical protein ACFFD4_22910 [Candidatus Odinarchaeota archaeon]
MEYSDNNSGIVVLVVFVLYAFAVVAFLNTAVWAGYETSEPQMLFWGIWGATAAITGTLIVIGTKFYNVIDYQGKKISNIHKNLQKLIEEKEG